mmetsp:Transcript_12912/g.25234  ORF Transcript_12912/g.25234 Transcript_12912/m.25234 type:complete len:92 (-) Transcript_12912:1616-1891(-)
MQDKAMKQRTNMQTDPESRAHNEDQECRRQMTQQGQLAGRAREIVAEADRQLNRGGGGSTPAGICRKIIPHSLFPHRKKVACSPDPFLLSL